MRRFAAWVVIVLAVVVGAVVFGAEPLLNSNAVRGRVAAGVEQATGHAVRLGGRIELGGGSLLALMPVLGVRDVALLNGAGFSREVFASVRRVEVRLGLMGLLAGRVEARSVTLVGPDVLLERDGQGRGNWERPVVAGGAEPGAEAGSPRRRVAVEVASVRVVNGRLEWRGAPVVEVPVLAFAPSGGTVEGQLLVNGVEVVVGGRMQAAGGAFEVTATGGGVVLAVSGKGDGEFGFRGVAGALETASGLVGRPLPAVRDVVVTGRVVRGGIGDLHFEAGEMGLGVPGLRLLTLKADAVDLRQPVQVLATGAMNALPIALAGSFGPLDRLGAVPVAVQVSADGGMVGAQGVVDPAARTMEGNVSARVADLGRLGTLAGFAAPGVRDLVLDVRVTPGPGGSVLLRGLRVGSSQGDLAGDLAVGWAPRVSMRGSLVSNRLVFDVPAGEPAVAVAPASAPVAQGAPARVEAGGLVMSDRALPFERLRAGDGDVRWAVGEAMYRGVTYRGIQVRALLQDGKLRVDPLVVAGPGGVLEGQVAVDAGAAPPTVAVTMRAERLDAGALLEGMTGAVEMDVALRAVGGSLHALAGSLAGRVAMALVEGEVENAELARAFGGVLRGANIPIDATGRSRVRCLAWRMEADGGQARVTTLALDATRLRVEGDGAMDLGGETMDMHLRPVVRIGGTGVAVPVRVSGPWRAPKAAADKGVVAAGRFGISIGVPVADICGPALAAVRAP